MTTKPKPAATLSRFTLSGRIINPDTGVKYFNVRRKAKVAHGSGRDIDFIGVVFTPGVGYFVRQYTPQRDPATGFPLRDTEGTLITKLIFESQPLKNQAEVFKVLNVRLSHIS